MAASVTDCHQFYSICESHELPDDQSCHILKKMESHFRAACGGMAEVVTTMHHRGKAQSLTEQDRWKLYGIGRFSGAPSINVR